MKQLTLLMALLVMSSSPSWSRPSSPPSQIHPPSTPSQIRPPLPPSCFHPSSQSWFRPPSNPPSRTPPFVPPEPPLEALSPPEPPIEALSPPEPPDPPDIPCSPVFLLLFDTSCVYSQPVSKAPDLKSCLLNMAFVFCDEAAYVVYVGDTSFVSKWWYPTDCSVALCWCDFVRPFIMLVMVSVDSTMGCSIPITSSASLPHPLIQVSSHRLFNLMLTVVDELISWVWYLEMSYGLFLFPALVPSFTAVCSLFTAVCSPFSVVFKSFQLWQLNGLMSHISIHHEKRVFLDVYCPVSSVMEFVSLPMSSSTLCCFVAGRVMLKIRDTSNTEVLIKGFVAMLKIVDCALVAASFSEFISLIVISIFQGFFSLYSSMVVEIRGLLDFICCLSVLYAPILLCCICFFVIGVCLAWMALFSCCMNTFSILGE